MVVAPDCTFESTVPRGGSTVTWILGKNRTRADQLSVAGKVSVLLSVIVALVWMVTNGMGLVPPWLASSLHGLAIGGVALGFVLHGLAGVTRARELERKEHR